MALGTGAVSVLPVVSGVGVALEGAGDVVDDCEEAPVGDGAAEPLGDGVHAEAATATVAASRANPRA
ncbi:hypothetical protein [Paenarthrobacter sp. FR1]|uniref:hypothetical protein n=1 Tax=Paenarthrobacter TaxID=1742992 RepID=UPI003DA64531